MARIEVTAGDISCDHCKRAIETDLGALDGVQEVRVDVARRRVRIDYDKTVVTPDRLREALDEIGYPAA